MAGRPPGGAGKGKYGNSCMKHGCSSCCETMRVPLLREDIDNISSRGYPDRSFYEEENGLRLLLRPGDRCYFLNRLGECEIFDCRPLRCRMYPLALENGGDGGVVIDGACLHRDEYMVSPVMQGRMLAYRDRLGLEATERSLFRPPKVLVRGTTVRSWHGRLLR